MLGRLVEGFAFDMWPAKVSGDDDYSDTFSFAARAFFGLVRDWSDS